jgi:hypothetical protein
MWVRFNDIEMTDDDDEKSESMSEGNEAIPVTLSTTSKAVSEPAIQRKRRSCRFSPAQLTPTVGAVLRNKTPVKSTNSTIDHSPIERVTRSRIRRSTCSNSTSCLKHLSAHPDLTVKEAIDGQLSKPSKRSRRLSTNNEDPSTIDIISGSRLHN